MTKTWLIGAAALALGGPAAAGLLTFEPFDEQGITLAAGDSISAQDFVIQQRSDAPTTLFAGNTLGSYASNGSSSSLLAANDAALAIRAAMLPRFNLAGFELGGGNLGFLDPANAGNVAPWAMVVDLVGLFFDGSQQTTSFTVDGTSAGLTAQTLDWRDLVEVRFSAQGDYSLDNLQLSAVPEPTSLALTGLALASLTLLRRRQRA